MRCFMNKNTEYELLVKDIFQTLANEESSTTISIQHNIKIVGISGQNHQIDVYYEFLFMGQKHKVIIECKNYSRRVSLDKLETFHSVLTDIGDVKGIFVSKNGFQEGAILYAKCYGIILKVLRHPTASDWIGTVKDIFISLNMSHIEVTNIEILFDKKWIKDQYGNCEIQCSAKTNEIFIEDSNGNVLDNLDALSKQILITVQKNERDLTKTFYYDDAYIHIPNNRIFKIDGVQYTYNVFFSTDRIEVRGAPLTKAIMIDVLTEEKRFFRK